MRIIDGHVHVGAWREPGFAGLATDLDDAVAMYERCGFLGALVTTTDTAENEALRAAIANHARGGQFRQAYWVDPGKDGDLAALEAMLPDVAALKIHPSFLRRPVTDAAFEPYLDLARGAGLPVVVHCGRWQEMAGYRLTLDVAERFPRVAFVLGHMGGDEPLLVRETYRRIAERGIDNAHLGTESLRQYWVVREAVDALGAGRIVFGSDYNLNHPDMFRALVDGLELNREARERILARNLNALLPRALRFFDDSGAGESEG